MDTRKHVLDLEAFREMLHISPRIPGQPFDEFPLEEEILEFLRFLGHSTQIKTLTDVNVNKLYQPWRSFVAVINKCLTGKSSVIDSLRMMYCSQRSKWLSAAARGKQPARATTPTEPTDVERTEAEQLKIVLKRTRQETHISQQRGSGTDEGIDEGTGSRPGVPNVPSNDKKETKKVNEDDDDEEEISKIGKQEAAESGEGDDEEAESDGESEDEETREPEEESFDP
nr:hypothetical protein [Tanacetum cinerariifolium]